MKIRNEGSLVLLGCVVLVLAAALLASAQRPVAPVPPLTKDEVLHLLKNYVSPAKVAQLVHERKIDFQVTPEVEEELRAAGATAALLAKLRALAPTVTNATPEERGTLSIESTPGNSEVYVDDERLGVTSREGLLRIPNLSLGQHRVRVSHYGYADYERTATMLAGAPVPITPRLSPLQPSVPQAPDKPLRQQNGVAEQRRSPSQAITPGVSGSSPVGRAGNGGDQSNQPGGGAWTDTVRLSRKELVWFGPEEVRYDDEDKHGQLDRRRSWIAACSEIAQWKVAKFSQFATFFIRLRSGKRYSFTTRTKAQEQQIAYAISAACPMVFDYEHSK